MCKTCTDSQKLEWGCDARLVGEGTWENAATTPLLIDGEDDFACPRRPIKDDPVYWNRVLNLYRGYTAGFLPDDGSVSSQSAKAWSLLTILDGFVNEAKAEQFENAKQSR